MNGAKLRARLLAGEAVTMYTPHHVSSGLAARLVELGADSVFVDCEHGSWSFEDVRMTAQIVRSVGGAAIIRPHSHERPIIIRYLNAGADGIMVRWWTRPNRRAPSSIPFVTLFRPTSTSAWWWR